MATFSTMGFGQVPAAAAAPARHPSRVAAAPRHAAFASTEKLSNRAGGDGLAAHHLTWGASEVDYNNDGRMDLWIGRHYHGADLWRQTARGTYVRVKTPAWPRYGSQGKLLDRHDCQWADVDRNGLKDAYCSTGRFKQNFVKVGRDNELWLQRSPGNFRDVGTKWRVGDVCARGRDVLFLDVNHDKFPDLFVGTDIPRDVPDPCNRFPRRYPNESSKLFINTRGTGFHYAKHKFDFGSGVGSRCAQKIDFNGDGWDDILACGSSPTAKRSGSGGPEQVRLFANRQGRGFRDETARLPAMQATDASVGDIDGDGDPDVVLSNYRGFFYSLNDGGHFGAPVLIGAPPKGVGRAVALGDADHDGDLDVFGCVGDGFKGDNPDDRLYLNDKLSFTAVSSPPARGTADEVIAVHPRHDARTEFLVLNGYHKARHPNIQLLDLTG